MRHVRVTKRPKKTIKETLRYSIRPDHTRRPIEIAFGVVDGLPAIVISFKFHQHRLSGYRAVRGRNLTDFGLYSTTAVLPYGREKLMLEGLLIQKIECMENRQMDGRTNVTD